ncbi:hypothetical protein EON65_02375 [archaeon]|nr:MAG: hypothetical protein EON65_02375 [archaeon]
MSNPSISRSSSAKGRIAQVLAHARASLQEPSRPVTPLTLDQRTSLNFTPSSNPFMDDQSTSAKNRPVGSSSSLKPSILVSHSVDVPLNSTSYKTTTTTIIYDDIPLTNTSSSAVEGELIGFLQNSLQSFRLTKLISPDKVVEFLQGLKQHIDAVIKAIRTQMQRISKL